MAYLDLASWKRRQHFDLFRTYEQPFFGVCAPVDVSRLRALTREPRGPSFSLAAFWLSMRAANRQEAFRRRLRHDPEQGPRVWVHERIGGGSTVLRDDETFGFAYFPCSPSFAEFVAVAEPAMTAARRPGPLSPHAGDDDLIHYSVLPWISFTSFAHARRSDATDSIPKIVFGRYYRQGERWWMPVSVELHHALADGLHAGRFFETFSELLEDPPFD